MTAVDSEIDSFIRQQKLKLANERQNLNLQEPANYNRENARRKWGPPVDLDTLKNSEKENYKRTWYELKGKYLEPSSSRSQTDPTMKLSPRGVLDTGALILDVQKEKEREEYEELWRRHHGEKPSPRLPINQAPINRVVGNTELSDPRKANRFLSPRTQKQKERDEYKRLWEQHHPEGNKYRPAENIGMKKGALDIDQIIQDVQRENMEEEVRMGGQTIGGSPNIRTNARELGQRKKPVLDNVNRQGGSLFEDSQLNIQNKIAEAKQEADDYRKRWEGQHSKVKFAPEPYLWKVHLVSTEERHGNWHHVTRERENFEKRVLALELILTPVLRASHRVKVLEQRKKSRTIVEEAEIV